MEKLMEKTEMIAKAKVVFKSAGYFPKGQKLLHGLQL